MIVTQVLFFALLFLLLLYTIDTAHVIPLAVFLIVWFVARVGRGVAALGARSERALRLGTKSIAWTVSLGLLALFSLAMTEVGANLPVTTTHWYSRAFEFNEGGAYFWPPSRYALSDGKVAVSPGSTTLRVYAIDEAGQIAGEPTELAFQVHEVGKRLTPATPVPVFDEQGELYVIQTVWRNLPANHAPRDWLCQTRLARVDLENACLVSPTELPIEEEVPEDYEYWAAYGAAFDGDRLVVLYASREADEARSHVYRSRYALAATYEWDESGDVRLARTISYMYYDASAIWGRGRHLTRGLDERLYVVGGWEGPIDPGRPDGSWGNASPGSLIWRAAGTLPVDSDMILGTHRQGLVVMKPGEPDDETVEWLVAQGRDPASAPTPVEVIGRVQFSPLAWIFRSGGPLLFAAGRERVWEVHDASAICYDVSDVRHPRKIAHVTPYAIQNAIVGSEYLLLDHGPGFSLVRHPD
jgi:hypothetical protein